MPMYGDNPWLEIHKKQQAENDPWHVDLPTGPRIPANANAKTARDLVASHEVAEFVNNNLSDPEVRKLLPEDEKTFGPVNVDGWLVFGQQDKRGWKIECQDETDQYEDVRFRLSVSFNKDHAMTTAARILREQLGTSAETELRELSESSIALLQRLAVADPARAIFLYMHNRLPENVAEEFATAYQNANSGNGDEELLSLVTDPIVSAANNEAVWQIWLWKTPQLSDQAGFEQFTQSRLRGGAVSLPVLDALFREFQTGQALDRLTESEASGPTEQEMDRMSDEELRDLLFRTTALKAQSNRVPGVLK